MLPAVGRALAQRPACVGLHGSGVRAFGRPAAGAAEVVLDVLFRGEVGAPRRLATRAIRESAECHRSGGIRVRLHQRRAARRSHDLAGRIGRDAARIPPARLHAPAAHATFDVHHADAMGCLHPWHRLRMGLDPGLPPFGPFARRTRQAGEAEFRSDVFVVDAQQALSRGVAAERKIGDGVAIGAEAALFACRRAGVQPAQVPQARGLHAGLIRPQGITPPRHDVMAQPGGHQQRIGP